MAFNLVDKANGLINAETTSKAAASLHETESGIRKAIVALISSVLTGILEKAGSPVGISAVAQLGSQAAGAGTAPEPGRAISGSPAGGISALVIMSGTLFGEKLNGITKMVAEFSGIRTESADSLLNLVAREIMGVLGSYSTERHFSESELAEYLTSQRESILNAIPPTLEIAPAFGLSGNSEIGLRLSSMSTPEGSSSSPYEIGNAPSLAASGMKWLLPGFLALLLFAGLLYVVKGCNGPTTVSTPQDSGAPANATPH